MIEHAVVIAGGGPTGMMLASELTLADVDVAIVERRATHDLIGSRAGGLHSRAIELLDQRGIADRFLSRGKTAQVARFAGVCLDIRYALGEGHPLLGRRMPDLNLIPLTSDGAKRVFELLHRARPVLLNLGERGGLDITPWADRVRRVDAAYQGAWELPVLGEVAAPKAVLIRPDGYVAWAGDLRDPALADALTVWFGPPSAP